MKKFNTCFRHNLRTVTRIYARFEALESLFNFLSNNEKISIKLMIFYSLVLALLVDELRNIALLNLSLWPLLLNAPIMNKYLQK